jgi:hypothetical protein
VPNLPPCFCSSLYATTPADFSGRLELQEFAKEAEQQLCSQVAVGNASAMMELATRYNRQELRVRAPTGNGSLYAQHAICG